MDGWLSEDIARQPLDPPEVRECLEDSVEGVLCKERRLVDVEAAEVAPGVRVH